MKIKKIILLLVCFLSIIPSLFASGKKDAEQTTIDNEWILCVTAFDFSLLPPAHRITGDVLMKKLVEKMQMVNYRFRLSPEYAYYESYTWQQEVGVAAKALASKHNERSQLLYRGDPDWKYRSSVKKVDADLVKLEADLREKEAQQPLINSEPVFSLHPSNLNGTYPVPPDRRTSAPSGVERRFCMNQKADAFLTGEIRGFYGRYYVRLGLFVLYANAWVYEDDIIFSLEDIEESVDEIAARLTTVLSGNRPATITVNAEPPESQILINQNYAGTGTAPPRERPPGTIIIAVGAEGFVSEIIETDLAAGEHVEVDVKLGPLHYSDVNINVQEAAPKRRAMPEAPGRINVYHGALYVGDAPYNLRLPIDQLNYVSIETRGGDSAKAVFASPNMPDESMDISLKLKRPPVGQRRVNKARGQYYWAWAGIWITGIAAWVTDGMYNTQAAATEDNKYNDSAFYDRTATLYYVKTGALIAVVAAVANEIFWMSRYIFTSTENAVPIIKKDKQKK